ncbi:hypothetical protein M422DRAFT_229957 [Sphaerobolus stellatus SS14]|uniref:Cyclopropane-fatty-acyl-phospholipid synthase n=1 Tax=Sphaerobolus stellatus (strain SS14) TaxID=990650 RepID=A0A0C9VRH3_SPHS4|nr:hypothetical protein M422DRAFT_229957 [Sphaerobolus stellatus SS14]
MTVTATQLLGTPTTHSLSFLRQFGSTLSQSLVDLTKSPLSRIARDRILGYLSKVEVGDLTIITSTDVWNFGTPPGESSKQPALKAVLYVRSEAFWTRVGLFTDLGLAESYMVGEIDCDDITSLLKIIILNRKQMGEVQSIAGPIAALCRSLAVYSFAGTMSNSRANISSHYDIGNIMFDAFLSKDMNYSCAIFKDHEEDVSNPSRESLEDAQMRKMKAILGKAKIQDGDNILEIGTGWGSLSILAAQTTDCTVTTITLSVDQMMLAVKRIAEAGLTDRISVHLMDFREILMNPEWKGAFNKFISIEMMEHVGKDFMEEYWKVVDYVLKEDSGVGVVQLTTLPESRMYVYILLVAC